MKLYLEDSEGALSGATAIKIDSLNLTIQKNLYVHFVNGLVDSIHNQDFMLFGDFSLLFEDETIRNYFNSATNKRAKIEVINTDIDLGGGVNPELSFVLPKAAFETWSEEKANDGVVKQTAGFEAHYDNSEGYSAKATLVNDVSSY